MVLKSNLETPPICFEFVRFALILLSFRPAKRNFALALEQFGLFTGNDR